MDTSIKYSIIIPHLNIPILLKRLIRSIPKRDDLQVIVVDDCSSSDNLSLVKSIKKEFPYVEFYSTDNRGGGGKARNVGLDHAKGEFLIFADADDYFNPCFEDVLEDYKNSDADIIYFSANSVDTETYENSDRAEYFHNIINTFLSTHNESDIRFGFVVPWGRFIRRSIVTDNNIRFAETWVSNDMKFSTESDYVAQKLAADKRAIYCVTDRRGSTSKGQAPEEMLSRLKTEAERYRFMKEHCISRHTRIDHFLSHYLRFKETKDENLIKKALKIMTDNQVDVDMLKRIYTKWKFRQIAHNILSTFHLARIHN